MFSRSLVTTAAILVTLSSALSIGCGAADEDTGSAEGAATGSDSTSRHITCDVAVAGKGTSFDVPLDRTLTADQQAAKECINDRPSIFSSTACPGEPLTYTQLKSLVHPGDTSRGLGNYTAQIRRAPVAQSGMGAWQDVPAGVLFRNDNGGNSSVVTKGVAWMVFNGPLMLQWGNPKTHDDDNRHWALQDCSVGQDGALSCAAGDNDHGNVIRVAGTFSDQPGAETKTIESKMTKTCIWMHGITEQKAPFKYEYAFLMTGDFSQ